MNYTEALEFFVENGITLNSEQLEALKENNEEAMKKFDNFEKRWKEEGLKDKYMDAWKNGRAANKKKQIAEWEKQVEELNEKIRNAKRIKLDDLE